MHPEHAGREPPLDRQSDRRTAAPAVVVAATGEVARIMHALDQTPAHDTESRSRPAPGSTTKYLHPYSGTGLSPSSRCTACGCPRSRYQVTARASKTTNSRAAQSPRGPPRAPLPPEDCRQGDSGDRERDRVPGGKYGYVEMDRSGTDVPGPIEQGRSSSPALNSMSQHSLSSRPTGSRRCSGGREPRPDSKVVQLRVRSLASQAT